MLSFSPETMPPRTMCNPDTDWLSQAKLGGFMHYLPSSEQFKHIYKFDVETLADQLHESNLRYFCLTLGQNSGYFNAPNAVYNELTGKKSGKFCSERDLPREMALACRKRGMRFMLYLPCQPPNEDADAAVALGFQREEPNTDRHFTEAGVRNWGEVIRCFSEQYGELVSGWWFDGGYEWIGMNNQIACYYAQMAKAGNPHSIVTFNPGVSLVRATDYEDYTAGEIQQPLECQVPGRWIEGSQAHILTYMGAMWEQPGCRFTPEIWSQWANGICARGGAITIDFCGNRDPDKSIVGSMNKEQFACLKAIGDGIIP